MSKRAILSRSLSVTVLVAAFLSSPTAKAQGNGAPTIEPAVRLARVFSDNMVLQQQKPLPIWGFAPDGTEVTVTLANRSARVPSKDGSWRVELPALPAGGPHELSVLTTDRHITRRNVMIGEVWLASGQSNMHWPLMRTETGEADTAAADRPNIRLLQVKANPTTEPLDDLPTSHTKGWKVCLPATARDFSGVAYHFALMLEAERKVPIGIIQCTVGGTPAESWTSREGLMNVPALRHFHDSSVEKPERVARRPSVLFNGMIHPLIPYACRGAIWYQGEGNVSRSTEYETLFPALINDWRQHWGEPLPFMFVQLANFRRRESAPGESRWAELGTAQALALRLPNTGMATAIDIGDADDIHPRDKRTVAHRLVAAALHVAYDETSVVHSGPSYRSMTVREDGSAVIRFDHAERGLRSSESELRGFALAGADRKFHWADAAIEGETVVLKCSAVTRPVAVRYAWADNPWATLYNAAGLPATPFRTDSWEVRDDALGADGLLLPFESLDRWRVNVPGASTAKQSLVPGRSGQALALQYKLIGDRPWAAAVKRVHVRLPEEFAVHLRLKGDGRPATVVVRLIDRTGAAYVKPLPGITENTDWTDVAIRASEFRYAWGGTRGRSPREIERIALAVSSNLPVMGTVCFDELRLIAK